MESYQYPYASVERAMKIQEVDLRAMDGRPQKGRRERSLRIWSLPGRGLYPFPAQGLSQK